MELLGRAGFLVREAADGHEVLRLVDEQVPDAVILDVGVRGVTGFVLCRLLRLRFGERLPIIFLSADRIEPFDRTAGLLLGADDYVVKPFDPNELLARVQRSVSRLPRDAITAASEGEATHIRYSELTPRESEVLKLLVEGLNQTEIARELVISPNTVATHIQRILMKLGVHNRAQAVAFAAREGLVRSKGTSVANRSGGANDRSKGNSQIVEGRHQ